VRQRKTLVIWRDDHLADPLGALFLTAPEKLEDAIVEKLKQYLGFRVKLMRVTISGSRIETEVESQGLHEESQRLVEAARGLRIKGMNRSAMATLKDALELDPLNGEAYRELGASLATAGKGREAFAALVRARETLGDSADLLIEIANLCLAQERTAAAIAYLERAHKVDPRNFLVRRALSALGGKQRPSKPQQPDGDSSATTGEPAASGGAAAAKSKPATQLPLLGDAPARGKPGGTKRS
jgi:tetratricopeptide (TPR) repeat protein